MEKKIVRTGLYSFILSLLLGILLFKEGHSYHADGLISVVYENITQYMFKVLRFSSLVTLFAIIIALVDKKNLLVTNEREQVSVIKLLCVAICVTLASYWLVIGIYVP